jgi:hypothetical protein
MGTNIVVVQQFYERFAGNNLDRPLALLTEDVELIQAYSLTYGSRYVRLTSIRDFFTRPFAYRHIVFTIPF